MKAQPFFAVLIFVALFAISAGAQTTLGYRQINLACHFSCTAVPSDTLIQPWGLAAFQDQSFFLAANGSGRVEEYDAGGQLLRSISLPLPAGSTATASKPTGVVADPDGNLSIRNTRFQLFAATEEGTIVAFTLTNGVPDQGTIVVDSSATADYTGLALLRPSCCNPVLAAANFHEGEIDVFGLSRIALPGAFEDPNLPDGYAPFNIQVLGDKVFVTYAKQDAAKRAPVAGAGNGIVSIFDQDGNFIRRFISDGGKLNAPWGITISAPAYGEFPNDILIGNVGDSKIGVFNPTTGEFLATLTNSEGDEFVNPGIRGMLFRSDRIGDPDTLYFVAGSEDRGQFSGIGVGRLTTTILSAENTVVGQGFTLVAEVHPNAGGDIATGKVTFTDNGVVIGEQDLANGVAGLFHTFDQPGPQNLAAEYQGTDNLLPSISRKQIIVFGPATTTTLGGPANAGPGTAVTFTSNTRSANAVPSGNITFADGDVALGTVPMDAAGNATFTTTTLSSGAHTIRAVFLGNTNFQGSTSAPLTVTVGGDFVFTPNLPSITVTGGQSADVMLTVSPNAGFAGTVRFSCAGAAGVTCAFNPATINVGATNATTRLTISTLPLARSLQGFGLAFASLGMFGTVLVRRRIHDIGKIVAVVVLSVLGIVTVACGGYNSQKSPQPRTSTLTVTATAGSVSHSTNISVTVR